MTHIPAIEIPKWILTTLNNLYDIERKLSLHGDPGNAKRNVERIKETFLTEGLFYEDPQGHSFSETRTDLEASIAGKSTEHLTVTEVIKPIIRYGDSGFSRVVQKGIVVVQGKEEEGA